MNLRPTLSILAVSALAILTAMSAEAALPLDCYQSLPGYQLQMFRDQEAQMLSWNQVYQQAPSGSAREREADIKRKAHARAALDVISAPGAIVQYPHREIDVFANEMQSKYNQASSGSFIESTYRSARDLALEAFRQKGIENLNCQTLSLDATLDAARTYQSLYNQASSGSRRESIYRELRDTAYSLADIRVEQELLYFGLNFRELEARAQQYQSLYNQASSGSRAESFYRRARDIAFQAAEQNIRTVIPTLSTYELSNLEREYHSRYNQASSGSRLESYARTVRDLLRNEIARRGGVNPQPIPQPIPQPVPQPPYCPPQTEWNPVLGRCVVVSPLPQPGPTPRCPDPNTVFDEVLNRCVSRF